MSPASIGGGFHSVFRWELSSPHRTPEEQRSWTTAAIVAGVIEQAYHALPRLKLCIDNPCDFGI